MPLIMMVYFYNIGEYNYLWATIVVLLVSTLIEQARLRG